MRYTGFQPQLFPRLYYFARILNTDTFVIRDDAQFVRKHKYPDGRTDKSFQAHSPIKQSFGIFYLSVSTTHHGFTPLYETLISDDTDWAASILKTLQISYSRAPYFSEIYSSLEKLLQRPYRTLSELTSATIFWGIAQLIGAREKAHEAMDTAILSDLLKENDFFRLRAIRLATSFSSFHTFSKLTANEKIISLCKELGATEDYCGGTSIAAYVDQDYFKENNITITVQDWHCPEYPQLFMKKLGFIPNLSLIDLLMNVSLDEARGIIKG